MRFNDLKVVWDSQNIEPYYAIDEEGLHSVLRSKSEKLRRLIRWQELQTYGSTAFMLTMISALLIAYATGMITKISPKWIEPNPWELLGLLIAATGWLYFGGAIYLKRKKQKRRAAAYTSTLRDELERDIEQVDYEISSRKHLVLGFIPPYLGGILFIWVFFRISGLPDWPIIPFTIFMVGALFFESHCQAKLVERELLPRKQDLEALREKLNNAEA